MKGPNTFVRLAGVRKIHIKLRVTGFHTIASGNVRSEASCACAGMRSEFLENTEPTFDPFHPSDSERTSFIVTILHFSRFTKMRTILPRPKHTNYFKYLPLLTIIVFAYTEACMHDAHSCRCVSVRCRLSPQFSVSFCLLLFTLDAGYE